jgi:hypothetical protein
MPLSPGVSRRTRQPRGSSALSNFVLVSVLFSANHGCVVSCLSLATAKLGNALGSAQSGTLYGFYTASSLLGATHVTKLLGPRNAMMAGMAAYVLYVACFWYAAVASSSSSESTDDSADPAVAALTVIGGAIGGWGAGFLWTAQGSYFVQAAKDHAEATAQGLATPSASDGSAVVDEALSSTSSTSELAGIFAFVYLAEEVLLRIMSTLLLGAGWSWATVFASYATIALVSTVLMVLVRNYHDDGGDDGQDPAYTSLADAESEPPSNEEAGDSETPTTSTARRRHVPFLTMSTSPTAPPIPPSSSSLSVCGTQLVSSTIGLLLRDPKMKFMVGPNVVFGWTAAFLNSYVNGQVVPSRGDASMVGLYTAWVSIVAAIGSLAVGRSCVTPRLSKTRILMLGSLCFAGVTVPFLMAPHPSQWNWPLLGLVYTLHGLGRCTFEGTLKAVFADYFGRTDKEGAFANIVLQNGLASSIGYVFSFALACDAPTRYCVSYRDGTLHDVLTFELLIVGAAIMAVAGLARASSLYRAEVEVEAEDCATSSEASQTSPLVHDRFTQ